MSSQIDFRTLPANVPVLCIPRVFANINEARIRRIFEDLNMGQIDRIDIISKKQGDKFNRVFVHFKRWNDSENSCVARERLLNGKEIKVIYDDPWFWKISAYREPERKPVTNVTHRKATLQLEYEDERRPPVVEKLESAAERITTKFNPTERRYPEQDRFPYRRPPSHKRQHQEYGIVKKKLTNEDQVEVVDSNVKPDEK